MKKNQYIVMANREHNILYVRVRNYRNHPIGDWDKMISHPFAKYAISYLLNCQNEKLPKETVISFEE